MANVNHTSSLTGGPVRNSSKNGTRISRFVFTLNNYSEKEYDWLTKTFPETYQPSWLIVAKEVGENGTPHLQGACILGGRRAFSTVKMWPGFRRAHMEVMHGRPLDSKQYCTKQDWNAFEYGTLPTPGKRTDLQVAVEAINEGSTLSQMANGDHGVAVVKYYKGLTVLRSLRSKPRDPAKPPTIYWISGATGTGKTKAAWELAISVGSPTDIWINPGTMQWFDGYDGQDVAIFDDFRAKGTNFAFLLRVTDRYPMSVPFKGGFVNWNPSIIIFTTPYDIANTFSTRAVHKPEDIRQLERRVTKEFRFPDEEEEFRMLFPTVNPGAMDDGSQSLSEPSSLPPTIPLDDIVDEPESRGNLLLDLRGLFEHGVGSPNRNTVVDLVESSDLEDSEDEISWDDSQHALSEYKKRNK